MWWPLPVTFHPSIAESDASLLLFHCPHIVHACQSAMSASVVQSLRYQQCLPYYCHVHTPYCDIQSLQCNDHFISSTTWFQFLPNSYSAIHYSIMTLEYFLTTWNILWWIKFPKHWNGTFHQKETLTIDDKTGHFLLHCKGLNITCVQVLSKK